MTLKPAENCLDIDYLPSSGILITIPGFGLRKAKTLRLRLPAGSLLGESIKAAGRVKSAILLCSRLFLTVLFLTVGIAQVRLRLLPTQPPRTSLVASFYSTQDESHVAEQPEEG